MIAVIVPFARPQMAENVLDNFMRQHLPLDGDKPEPIALIVVENGPAVGTVPPSTGIHVVQSQHGRAHARTAGLNKARELGCEWYAFWDDDDWYDNGYLEFMWGHRDKADVIGFCQHVLETPDGGVFWQRYCDPGELPLVDGFAAGGVAAATLFGRTARAVDWDAHVDFGEEVFWYADMLRGGCTIYGVVEPDKFGPVFVLKRYSDKDHGHALPLDHDLRTAVPVFDTLRLNLGCGSHKLQDWGNYDTEVDLREPLPWLDNSVDFVLLEHVLEHLTTPKGVQLLRQVHRMLKPGGVVRIAIPDFDVVLGLGPEDMLRYLEFLRSAGQQVHTADDALNLLLTGWEHQSAWSARLLTSTLQANGFQVRPCIHGQSLHPELRGVDGHSAFETSVLEATKPLCAQL